ADGAGPAVLLGNAEGASELPSVHRRGADVARFAGLDDIMQRFERLLDRRVMVETVDLVKVDIVHAEPTQAVVDLGEDRLTRQSGAIGAGTHPAIDLGGNDDLVAAREILDRAAEDFLAAAERIEAGAAELGIFHRVSKPVKSIMQSAG